MARAFPHPNRERLSKGLQEGSPVAFQAGHGIGGESPPLSLPHDPRRLELGRLEGVLSYSGEPG